MKLLPFALAGLFVVVGLLVQWRDCIPGRGNSMGIRSVYTSFWLFAALALGVGTSLWTRWWWGLAAGLSLMMLQRAVVELVERAAMKLKA